MGGRLTIEPASRPPITVSFAWRRYLVATRTADQGDYERIEERAWARLQSELSHLEEPRPERK